MFHRFLLCWPCSPPWPTMPLWYVVWIGERYLLTKGLAGSRGGTHPKINYKTLNEQLNTRSQQFFENQLSMRSHTKSVCRIWYVCIWSTTIDQYIWNKAIDLSIVFVWKCTWWDKAENGVSGKEIQLFFLNDIKLVKMHLMLSLYIWLSIYTNNESLRIIWKFDFSSRGF